MPVKLTRLDDKINIKLTDGRDGEVCVLLDHIDPPFRYYIYALVVLSGSSKIYELNQVYYYRETGMNNTIVSKVASKYYELVDTVEENEFDSPEEIIEYVTKILTSPEWETPV